MPIVANSSVFESKSQDRVFINPCAEMCGTYHSMMNFEVRVVRPQRFRGYRQRVDGKTNAEALRAISNRPLRYDHPPV